MAATPGRLLRRKKRLLGAQQRSGQMLNEMPQSAVQQREGFSYVVGEYHDTLASVNDTSSSLQLRDLDRAMAKLPLEQRQIILLVALEGMSYEGVSELVGIPIGTVRSRLSRGRMILRQMMDTGDRSAPAKTAREGRVVPLAAEPSPAVAFAAAG